MARTLALMIAGLLATPPAIAHELWLEPTAPRAAPGAVYEVKIRIGQMLEGPDYSYLPSWFDRFEVIENGVARPVASMVGDLPAVSETADGAGLVTLVFLSNAHSLEYKDFQKFEAFVETEGLDRGVEMHRARGLPESGFVETYVRSAKALIAVGDGEGADAPRGLPFEFVAEANPFSATSGIPVRLTWKGAPQENVQVSIFRRAPDGVVTVERARTGFDGRIAAPTDPGFYLLSAVRLMEPPPELAKSQRAVWHSVWASLAYWRR